MSSIKQPSMSQFITAVKSFLEDNEEGPIEAFSSRLSPYRIESHHFGGVSKLILVLEDQGLSQLAGELRDQQPSKRTGNPRTTPHRGVLAKRKTRKGLMTNIMHTARASPGENEHCRRIASYRRTGSRSYNSRSTEAEVLTSIAEPLETREDGNDPAHESLSGLFWNNGTFFSPSRDVSRSCSPWMNYDDIEPSASENSLFCINPMTFNNPFATITPPMSSIPEETTNSESIANDGVISTMEFCSLPNVQGFNTPPTPLAAANDSEEIHYDSLNILPLARSCEVDDQFSTAHDSHSLEASERSRSNIQAISANCIREDFLEILEVNLSYWKENGLWGQQNLPNPLEGSGHENLKIVYLCLCQLDRSIQTDPIRERVALVILYLQFQNTVNNWKMHDSLEERPGRKQLGIGQGKLTRMIDSVLRNSHPDWDQYNDKRKTYLRARFHNRKRYGKRWSILTEELGPAILFLCSPILANTVRDTSVTLTELKIISSTIHEDNRNKMNLLEPMQLIADDLLHGRACTNHDVHRVMLELRYAAQPC
ncbi:hypothetical protein BGW36DRAFT_465307 [Talaromyces proteolyticus]|uniref:Uncharacterized protein n=1 Tax=Talaromyces proteolyticus TaxID=1131652 RepID=A0AAD4KMV8_9EURO|nr:uncharacterized protein BGW36DRAFT_465307 [Talaromyces proteolyticus]KAH8691590.1 hypothetical protein BGW36DRAFT_465307 [Talaromyces proteolyticus]